MIIKKVMGLKRNVSESIWSKLKNQTGFSLEDSFWEDISGLIPALGPRIDVYQTRDEVVVVIELPGIHSADKIELKLRKKNTLLIKGNVDCDYPIGESDMHLGERYFGEFERKLKLPHEVTTDGVKAVFEHGLLTLRLPILPEAEDEQVMIKLDADAKEEDQQEEAER
ncbi:Hsp20/alpha crystallin family protein [Ferviditalea candida]|uniref:Hsp20/alpha crystallin family protein n=1 Tax=Ferviditalea candida TaxID=3108399 RepID=A0ABU5ZDG6_9BACL|nr:Hsp20/alpha crystallin family protein [Paenibacillaceae bacterium T2]